MGTNSILSEIAPAAQQQERLPAGADLPEHLQRALKTVTRRLMEREAFARRGEVIDARRQRFFWEGEQYIYCRPGVYVFASANSGAVVPYGDAEMDMPAYTKVYNIYEPYGRSIIAVLTQNPPGIKAEPMDPGDEDDVKSAQAAESIKTRIDQDADAKRVQAESAKLFWTDSRVVVYTHIDDGDDLDSGSSIIGPSTGPRVVMEVNGALESKVPRTARSRAEMGYCALQREIDVSMAKDKYPDFASKIEESGEVMGAQKYERLARLGVMYSSGQLMQTGDSYMHLVTWTRIWIRPSQFRLAPAECRDELRETFPDGAYVAFCGDQYVDSRNESMDEHIVIRHPRPGEGMSRKSLGYNLVPLQETYNDYRNCEQEYLCYGVPLTFYDQELIGVEELRKQKSEPGNHVPVLPSSRTRPMAESFYREPEATVPPSLVAAYNDLRGELAQMITGALPALFGEPDSSNKTATGISILRDQAMGQIGIAWGALQELYAEAYWQAVRIFAEAAETDEIAVPGKLGAYRVSVADIAAGNFRCVPSQDSSLPMTIGAKRNAFMQLFDSATRNPELMEIFGEPDNMELAKEYIGLDNLVIPGAEARNKQLEEIKLLLQGAPVPPPLGPDGLPQPGAMPEPTVPIDPEMDFHQYEFMKGQAWINSPEGQAAKRDNPQGFENVRLHLLLHKAAMQQGQQQKEKPPSESINFKDLPPEGQMQMAAQAGIRLAPPQPTVPPTATGAM